MSKVLVIPDVHEDVPRVRHFLDTYADQVDHVVFTGDYFDTHNKDATDDDLPAVCEFLLSKLDDPSYTFILGNHDTYYKYRTEAAYCSGTDSFRLNKVNAYISKDSWNKFKFYKEIDGITYSHAGFHKDFLARHEKLYGNRSLEEIAKKTDHAYSTSQDDSIYTLVDFMRGGRSHFGNYIWGDWSRLDTVDGMRQVVGHSKRKEPQIRIPRIKGNDLTLDLKENREVAASLLGYDTVKKTWSLPDTFNLDLDTVLKYAAIIEDGKTLKLVD